MWSHRDTRWANVVLATGMATVLLLVGPTRAATSPAGAQGAVARDDFVIAGEVDGLYPGIQTTLATNVTNPQAFTIRVVSVDVTVDDANAGCSGAWLHFGRLAGPVDVLPGTMAAVPVPLEMDFAAPEACREASWPLTFVATAVDADTDATATNPKTGDRPPPGPNALAPTGLDVAPLVAIAVLLIAVGIVLQRHARRSRP